jgi:solute carrier family 45, member 1/2/4
MLALVWIAGPLSGVLVQPYVGIKSDRCRNKLGKRRPFVIGGAIATIASLMILAWTREIVGGFLGLFGADPASRGVAVCIMVFAVLFVYILDFAINVIQAALRAYIVDCAPTHQQESANAWISRTSGVGNIFGMFCGGLNLPKVLPFLGNTQFKVLCAIVSISMAVTVGISCASIPERDPRIEPEHPNAQDGMIPLFKSLWQAIFRLPPQIAKVCRVQFMSWMGWFPFLFYTTTYIGEIYVEPFFKENPHMSEQEVNELWDRGTRRGTVALLIFAITTFVSAVFLPFIVAPTFQQPITVQAPATPLTPTIPSNISGSSYFRSNRTSSSRNISHWQKVQHLTSDVLSRLQIRSLTLRRTWLYSHIFFAVCMFLTFLIRSVALATAVVGLAGVPWAVTSWAPWALISSEVSKRDAIRRGLLRAPPVYDDDVLVAGEDDSTDQAGVVLGIHNVAISAPQVIATLLSSLIFKFLQKPRGTPGDESVGWCFRLGGLCALGAAVLTLRVKEDREEVFIGERTEA